MLILLLESMTHAIKYTQSSMYFLCCLAVFKHLLFCKSKSLLICKHLSNLPLAVSTLIAIRIVFLANINNSNNVQLVSCLYFITLQVNINTAMKVAEIHFFWPLQNLCIFNVGTFYTYWFKCVQISESLEHSLPKISQLCIH